MRLPGSETAAKSHDKVNSSVALYIVHYWYYNPCEKTLEHHLMAIKTMLR